MIGIRRRLILVEMNLACLKTLKLYLRDVPSAVRCLDNIFDDLLLFRDELEELLYLERNGELPSEETLQKLRYDLDDARSETAEAEKELAEVRAELAKAQHEIDSMKAFITELEARLLKKNSP